jgi:hypothetical protein
VIEIHVKSQPTNVIDSLDEIATIGQHKAFEQQVFTANENKGLRKVIWT